MLRESPSVSWGHPTGAVPAQGVHQGCLQQGQGMSCSGQDCSVQFPLQLNEPGLISALVTLGRPAGSCCSWGLAKPRLVLPAATVSLCVQQFQKGFFFFFPKQPLGSVSFSWPGTSLVALAPQRPPAASPCQVWACSWQIQALLLPPLLSLGSFLVPHPAENGSLLLLSGQLPLG